MDPLDIATLLNRKIEELLVARGAIPIEQARLGQQRGARADGHHDPRLLRSLAQKAQELLVLERGPGPDAARHQNQVERRAVIKVELCDRLDPRCRSHRANLLCYRNDLHIGCEAPEHLEWAVQVEELELGVENRAKRAGLCFDHEKSSGP